MRANLRGKEEITKQFAKNYSVSHIGSRTEIKNWINKTNKIKRKEIKKEWKEERKTKHWLKQKQKLKRQKVTSMKEEQTERTEKDNWRGQGVWKGGGGGYIKNGQQHLVFPGGHPSKY